MDVTIAELLLQDGLTTGAIYLLLAIGLLLVFLVTRVIFIPQGDFVAYGALTLASMLAGHVPATLWLLDVCAVASALLQWRSWRGVSWALGPALLITLATLVAVRLGAWVWLQGALAVGITALLAPMVYRLAFRPLRHASLLTLLVVAMAVHFVMVGLGLVLFGPETQRTPAFSNASFTWGEVDISGHSLWVAGCCVVLVVRRLT